MNEELIINNCIKLLDEYPAIQGVSIQKNKSDHKLTIHSLNKAFHLSVIVKPVLKRPLPQILHHSSKGDNSRQIILAEYINPSIARELAANHFQFVDTSGTIHLQLNNQLYIHVEGKKVRSTIRENSFGIYSPKGMQILLILLVQPEIINRPIRKISEISGVSYGQTQLVIKSLIDQKLVYKDQDHIRGFVNKREILEKWLVYYGDILRQKLVLGTYKMPPLIGNEIQKHVASLRHDMDLAVSGALGADLLIPYYRGESIELFIHTKGIPKIIENLKLIPANDTNVTLFNLFSPLVCFPEGKGLSAHPLLIYAELLYKKNSRSLEMAKLIFEQYVEGMLNAT